VPLGPKAFPGTGVWAPEGLPDVDVLLISHDHYDHLERRAVMEIRGRTRAAVMGLGTGAHLERWGWDPSVILEGDWWDTFGIGPLAVTLVPARHGSNRGLTFDRALWTGFVVEGGGRRVYYSGDSGYGPHFADIGRELGPFDMGLIETGQYDGAWPLIHMTPEEGARAAQDLGVRRYLPVHLGKYAIASHPWDEPLERAFVAAQGTGAYRLVTPIIGETVMLDDATALYRPWWRGLR
jgi:L-ascorbate metabolism protein UlaG (beta-lactamase superfamily)